MAIVEDDGNNALMTDAIKRVNSDVPEKEAERPGKLDI